MLVEAILGVDAPRCLLQLNLFKGLSRPLEVDYIV
jgi:hypothetical protein